MAAVALGEVKLKRVLPSFRSKGAGHLHFNALTIPNSDFNYILPMFDICTRYITFLSVNPLNTVMCIQILNHDYSILETDIYYWASGIVGRLTVYS